jgi:four helix bundle protein
LPVTFAGHVYRFVRATRRRARRRVEVATFEALDVSVEMIAATRPLLAQLGRRDPDLARQLRRAATSIALNLAEGARRDGRDRQHSFRVAAGSSDEVRAGLRIAEALGQLGATDLRPCRELLDRVAAMTYRLIHGTGTRDR